MITPRRISTAGRHHNPRTGLGRLLSGTYWLLLAVDAAGLAHQLVLGAPDHLLVALLTVATLGLALRLSGRFWRGSI